MKRTKTNKKLFSILSAIIGVVFAFSVGITYAPSALNLRYGSNPVSTDAFIGNQQVYVINDTISNPVVYGSGANNFEVAIQYSVAYDFDVRIAYSLTWSNGESANNVILNYVNRDNIICDEKYIYLAETVPAGSGKITLISGASFVDAADMETYGGATLTVNITNSSVKIYKAQSVYDEEHPLYTEAMEKYAESTAAPAWVRRKKNKTADSSSAYAMVYNYRYNYAQGIPYPQAETAYKKPAAQRTFEETLTDSNSQQVINSYTQHYVYGTLWGGGNRYYAGVGIYVIAGSEDLELEIQVAGVWRTNGNVEKTFENNIQYNYNEKYWDLNQISSNKLWEIRTFKYKIEARSARYIEILDSVEVISARGTTNPSAAYRLVTNNIIINPLNNDAIKSITYSEANCKLITYSSIGSNVEESTKTIYPAETISIVNTTKYSNGLYDSYLSNDPSQQKFNANISLINNTADFRTVSVNYHLYYHLSNGVTKLYNDQGKRASDLINGTTVLPKHAFISTNSLNLLYYSYSAESDETLDEINGEAGKTTDTVIIPPYSSVNIMSQYSVGKELSDNIVTLFDDTSTVDFKEFYDAWTYIELETVSNEIASIETTPENATEAKTNLLLEATKTATQTVISVKNNTNMAVTGIEINNLAIREYKKTSQDPEDNKPFDWDVSYWKYYDANSNRLTEETDFDSGLYHLETESYSQTTNTITYQNDFKVDETKSTRIYDNGETKTTLLPGESVIIALVDTTNKVVLSGTSSASSVEDLTGVTIINNGTTKAYLVNYTENSYYLRLNTNISSTNFFYKEEYGYYMGILRPGQILTISLNEVVEIEEGDLINTSYEVEGVPTTDFNADLLKDWDVDAVAKYSELFNIEK